MTALPSAVPRVLVVDDDGSTRALHAFALESAGFATLQAEDGPAALVLLRAEHVDVVLLDQSMPGMLGTDVVQAIRADARTRTTPVILVTGHTAVADRVQGLDAGASDYIVKPVDPDELVARVRAHLRGRATLLAVVEDRLRQRTSVVAALCRIPGEGGPLAVAGRICEQLLEASDVDGAALVAFADTGGAVALASAGSCRDVLSERAALPPRLARRLEERAMTGPFLARGQEAAARLFGSDGGAVACAPLRVHDRAPGLLALVSRGYGQWAIEQAPTALSAAIDAAGIASALLGPGLTEGGAVHAERAQLRRIVEARAFRSVFQPIVDLDRGDVVGYELLTRFDDGVSPAERFAAAARSGMMIELEAATMAEGLEAAGELDVGPHLSVNVSAPFLADARVARLVRRAAQPLVLEITEREPVEDYDALRAALRRLGRDVRMSVDDAGAGYASLQHILALRPAFVKLDRTWIAGIHDDAARQALVAGLTSFAERTGCELIAEGIEEEAELDAVRDLRVRLGQGYLLGRPRPARG